jgi:hypothetical protein
MKIDLKDRKENLVEHMSVTFRLLNLLPPAWRNDEKARTGIMVLIREPDTRNLIFFPVEQPSEYAMFFAAEKAVRSHIMQDAASENTSDPMRMQFAGSISVHMNGMYIQISVSGMKSEEDVALAENIIGNGGKLPECFFQKDHYLNKFLGL